jgi:hypothetical protein
MIENSETTGAEINSGNSGVERSRLPSEVRRDRDLWAVVRVPRDLKARIDELCEIWTERYVTGRTADIAPSDRTGMVPPHALIERAIRDMENKRLRSARSRSAAAATS